MSRTCTACRGRKMRCDGALPQCGPCSRARKPMECKYTIVRSHSQGPKAALLQKGAACLPCRRKKKKCDAQRPACNTCQLAGKEFECEYDEDIRQDMNTVLLGRIQELQGVVEMYKSQQQQLLMQLSAQPAPSPSIPFTPNMNLPQYVDLANLRVALPGFSGPSAMSNMPEPIPFLPMASSSSFEIDSQISMNEPLFRVLLPDTPADPPDLYSRPLTSTFELRSTFLAHSIQIGVYLRDTKWKAVKDGDQSGEIVHPSIVFLSQLIGGILWRLHSKTHSLSEPIIDSEAELRKALAALTSVAPDPATLVSINCLIAWYYLYHQQLKTGQRWLMKAFEVVERNDLQLTPPASNAIVAASTEPDEDTKELITTMSQLLFLDKAGEIVLNLPSITNDKFDQAVRDFPNMQPWMAKNNIVSMRARSVYFLYQALRLSRMRMEAAYETRFQTSDYEVLSSDWFAKYWETLEDATQHVAILSPQMLKTSLSVDPRAVPSKVCMIIAMAAQLELYRHLAPGHVDTRNKLLNVVCEIVDLTKGFKDEDFVMLDPVLGTCWQVVATALWQEREHFVRLIRTEASQYREVFDVMIACAAKMGASWPFMEGALRTLNNIAATVNGIPLPPPPQTTDYGLDFGNGVSV